MSNIQVHHGRQQIELRADSVGDEVGIDKNTVGRAEGSVCGKEHVRWSGLDMAGQLILGLRFLRLFLEAFVAGFDRSLHLLEC